MTRSTLILIAGLVAICPLLTSCIDQKAFIQRIVPHEDDLLARQMIESLRVGDYDKANAELDSSLQGPSTDEALHKLHDLLARGDILEIEIVGCNITLIGEKHRSDLSYQVHFPAHWIFGDVVIDTQDGSRTISGIHFHEISKSLESLNQFSLEDKSITHYAVFASCILIPIFILYALIVCIRSSVRRKWLWIIFIIFGITQISFNWTTAAWNFKPLSIQLFGSGYSSGLYAPYIFKFGFPVGAVVFLTFRGRRRLPPIRSK
jgi:hypothetical protein